MSSTEFRFTWLSATNTVVEMIDQWTPPATARSESNYEDSLYGFLHGQLPTIQVTKDYARGRSRADICVGERVLIELKTDLQAKGDYDRLVGQLNNYKTWKMSGVLVVLTGVTDENIRKDLTKVIEELNTSSRFWVNFRLFPGPFRVLVVPPTPQGTDSATAPSRPSSNRTITVPWITLVIAMLIVAGIVGWSDYRKRNRLVLKVVPAVDVPKVVVLPGKPGEVVLWNLSPFALPQVNLNARVYPYSPNCDAIYVALSHGDDAVPMLTFPGLGYAEKKKVAVQLPGLASETRGSLGDAVRRLLTVGETCLKLGPGVDAGVRDDAGVPLYCSEAMPCYVVVRLSTRAINPRTAEWADSGEEYFRLEPDSSLMPSESLGTRNGDHFEFQDRRDEVAFLRVRESIRADPFGRLIYSESRTPATGFWGLGLDQALQGSDGGNRP